MAESRNSGAPYRTFKVILEIPDLPWMHPIRPTDIRTRLDSRFRFGKYEIEVRARRLVEFFQRDGYWRAFRPEEFQLYLVVRRIDPATAFFGLLGAWLDDADGAVSWREPADVFIAMDMSGNYYVTDRFIERCV